jgi:glycosyltransferase involved in cell wall biosynthesis
MSAHEHSGPLVSIGIPIYNEGRFLEQSLASILTQDYKNLEIIISDNASTDNSRELCQKFVDKDARISYSRFGQNRGVTENFRHVLDLAAGKYFMWAAGHDLWSQDFISQCVRLLENDSEGVVAFGSAEWINATGSPIARISGWTDTRGMDAVARFFSVFWGNMHPILGVIRMETLRRIRFPSCVGTDLVMLSELALKGHFMHARTTGWSRREFRQLEGYRDRMKRYRSTEFGLSRSLVDRAFPVLRLPLELVGVVLRSRIRWFEKVGILAILVPSLPVKYAIGRRVCPTTGQTT